MKNETVIVDERHIEDYRLTVIEHGLKLEAGGLRHSRNSVRKAAEAELRKAGMKPERNALKLYLQFKNHRSGQ